MQRPARSNRTRFANLALAGTSFLGLILGLQLAVIYLAEAPLSDVRAYYDAGARLNAGVPLYEQPATTNEAAYYRYPPLLAILFRPLALLPFELAAIAWEVVVLATFGLTLHRLGLARKQTWLLVGLLGIPIGWSLAIGQAQVPVTYLAILGTPFTIALAGQLKLLPAIIAIFWIGRRDWSAFGRFVAWSVGLVVIQLILEPAGTIAYPATLGLDQVGQVRNWSPYAISPILWAVVVVAGAFITLRLAPGRYGWAAAVGLSILATPRLLIYQLMTLLAAGRQPR